MAVVFSGLLGCTSSSNRSLPEVVASPAFAPAIEGRHVSAPIDLSPARSIFRLDASGVRASTRSHALHVDEGGAVRFRPRVGSVLGAEIGFSTTSLGGALTVPTVVGDHVTIERARAVEHVRDAAMGIEQSWTFAERPSNDDLVVSVRVAGRRFAGATSGGLHFGEPGALVRYGMAQWIDASGTRTEIVPRYEASSEGGTIVMTVPAAVLSSSTFPATLDPVIGGEIDLDVAAGSSDHMDRQVAGAFDGSSWLLVWTTGGPDGDNRVRGARIDKSGKVLDGGEGITLAIGSDTVIPTSPSVSFDGTRFFVVWSTSDESTGYSTIHGARVSASGALLDTTPLVVGDTSKVQTSPAIAFDGTNEIVLWIEGSDVIGQRVSTSGTLSGTPFKASITGAGYLRPAIACGATGSARCLATWSTITSSSGTSTFDIFGVRLGTSGGPLDTSEIAVNGAVGAQIDPVVDWDGTQWVSVWQDSQSSPTQIRGARVGTDGSVADTTSFVVATSIGNQAAPSITFDGTRHLVTWMDFRAGAKNPDIYGARLDTAAKSLDSSGVAIATATTLQRSPVVVASGSNALVAWQDLATSTSKGSTIDAARVSSTLAPLDSPPILVAPIGSDESAPAVAFDGTNYFVVWDDDRAGSTYARKILGVRVSATGTVLDSPAISLGAGILPRVAFDGTNFLVVWQAYGGGVYGSRVSSAGSVVDSPGFSISASGCTFSTSIPCVQKLTPDVACSKSNCLVVWADDRDTDPWLIDRAFDSVVNPSIYGLVLKGSTYVKGVAISTPGTGAYATFDRLHPAVDFDGKDFMVVWTKGQYGAPTDYYRGVYGARVQIDGTLLDPGGLDIASGDSALAPSIAFDGTHHLVVWDNNGADDGDVYGARLTVDGKIVGGAPFAIATATGAQLGPRAAFTDDKHSFLVAWGDARGGAYDLLGSWIGQDGTVRDVSGVTLSGSKPFEESRPAIGVAGAGKMLVAYRRSIASHGRVVARLVSSGTLDGGTCTSGSECASRGCVDGVCCDTACTGVCQGCAVTGSLGTCTAVVSADDADTCTGDDTCDAKGACLKKNGKACTTSTDCASGFCVDGFCCATACDGGCGVCDATPGTCTAAKLGSKGAHPVCPGYLCDGKALACPTTCATDTDCASDFYCSSANICEASKKASASCNATTDCASPPCRECASTFCADGYCCDKACDGACDECALDPGTCHFTKKGKEGAPSCAPYACTGASSACNTECATKDDCAPGGWCEGGKCFANRELGKECAKDEACKSGHCADKVCCNAKCSGQCEACDVDGSKGTCTAVVGKPQPPRDACGGGSPDAPCSQLGCDGVVRTTCAGYAGKDTICAKAKCEAGAESPVGRCDGKGACGASSTPCDPYVCGPSACKTSCTTDADCVKGLLCDGGRCKSTSRCDGAHTLQNLDGSTTDCAPYACIEDGICRKSCRSTSECADGFQCDEHGACVPAPPAENASGCGCRLGGESDDRGSLLLAGTLFAWVWTRRRRREVST